MRTVSINKSLIAASANCIATSQSVVAGASFVINGGSAVAKPYGPFAATETIALLDSQRRIAIVSAGNDSTTTVTIKGFPDSGPGMQISEVLTLTNGGTAVSALDYLGVVSVTPSAATASTAVIGTNTTGSTPWSITNFHLTPFIINDQVEQTGSVTWNFETTNDFGWWAPPASSYGTNPQPNVNEVVQGSAIAQNSTVTSAVTGYRHTITAGTGTLQAQTVQSGIANY